MGRLLSKEIRVDPPLSILPMTSLDWISEHARMQRSHRMHASWSTSMTCEEESDPFSMDRVLSLDSLIPSCSASSSSSQSPVDWCFAQGLG